MFVLVSALRREGRRAVRKRPGTQGERAARTAGVRPSARRCPGLEEPFRAAVGTMPEPSAQKSYLLGLDHMCLDRFDRCCMVVNTSWRSRALGNVARPQGLLVANRRIA